MLAPLAYIHEGEKNTKFVTFPYSRLNHAHKIYGGPQGFKTGS